MISAGIDIGSTTAQAVILRDREILSYANMVAGINRIETAQRALDQALTEARVGRGEVRFIVGTGYGRYQIPFADKNVTEISCHARGANYFFPAVRTILDMGGQDCKAIRCDPQGKVEAFVMNDKCAAGTGRSMEVLSRLLSIPLDQIGPLSLQIAGNPPRLSSSCAVFAKSEALRMLRNGVSRNEVLAAYCQALAGRVAALISRVGMKEELAITGGIAKNPGVVARVENELHTRARICFEPQIVGAVGAALIAREQIKEDNENAVRS